MGGTRGTTKRNWHTRLTVRKRAQHPFSGGTPVGLGSGFDAISAGLTLLKRSGPLVFFSNYTYTPSFAGAAGGTDVDLGNIHGLRFGTALTTSPAPG